RELRVELASVLLRLERDPREGFALLGRVLAEEPRHPGALSVLETIVEEEEGRRKVEAARLLAPLSLAGREVSQARGSLELPALARFAAGGARRPPRRDRALRRRAGIAQAAEPGAGAGSRGDRRRGDGASRLPRSPLDRPGRPRSSGGRGSPARALAGCGRLRG